MSAGASRETRNSRTSKGSVFDCPTHAGIEPPFSHIISISDGSGAFEPVEASGALGADFVFGGAAQASGMTDSMSQTTRARVIIVRTIDLPEPVEEKIR